MHKAHWRKTALAHRRDLTPQHVQAQSQALAEHLIQYFTANPVSSLHIFLPIRKHNEIDTFLIWEQLRQRFPAMRFAASVSDFQTFAMRNYWLENNTNLVENAWGIPEPVGATLAHDADFEAVLVPLLAFDEKGFRVGYGKGFYDRFLAKCRPDVRKIGLSLTPPVPAIADAAEHDIKLDLCVCPDQIYYFQD
ncbi:5-formyltetrahydrofolate cyclo-ligase [Flexibacter flexilis DSM 6793]|uniref:5-formyltetrahydrofolate cyclo-ligase n=1 Tax=Flexibacter flexilis DSM 6793 TaxID=927664 RepID=A0A1I1ECT4_9BACT|nr:5-formyltetrahydrofolate cyclo-ligase [Flexibacter flexilis]SFB84392.1 5-formyltetrahydrofolate cyclo-ligase [Flexibacter flexilis DSM 6793]